MPTPTKRSRSLGSVRLSWHSPDPSQLLSHITAGEVWMVKGSGGLILEKPHMAEWVGLGAAVGLSMDRLCQAVIPCGQVCLTPPASYLERQWAYRRRIRWIDWQQSITEAYPAARRGQLLLKNLQTFLPLEVWLALPDPLLAKLAGLPLEVMSEVRRELPEPSLLRG